MNEAILQLYQSTGHLIRLFFDIVSGVGYQGACPVACQQKIYLISKSLHRPSHSLPISSTVPLTTANNPRECRPPHQPLLQVDRIHCGNTAPRRFAAIPGLASPRAHDKESPHPKRRNGHGNSDNNKNVNLVRGIDISVAVLEEIHAKHALVNLISMMEVIN